MGGRESVIVTTIILSTPPHLHTFTLIQITFLPFIPPHLQVNNSEAVSRVRRWLEEGKTTQEAAQSLVEFAMKVNCIEHVKLWT